MIVLKFGGTSIQDADAIDRAAAIVRSRTDRAPVVVVSALGGVTDGLLHVAELAASGQFIPALLNVEALRDRHLAACDGLLAGDEADDIAAELSAAFDELAHLAEALSRLAHLSPRSLDTVAAMGERLSSMLVAAAFRDRGIPAEHVDARSVMVTDDHFGKAAPRPEETAERCRTHVAPLVADGRVPVLGGYIGATAEGVTTTLGRGGSDYSAALMGAAMSAEAIEIWTDVDGILTADPRVVADARIIESIRFDEAAELASFGAKVLHPSTIAPAVRLGIPVYVLNARRPEGTGTRISFDAPRRPVTAVAVKRNVTVVRVKSPRMLLAHGFMRGIFEVFERNRTSVDVVATSEVSVSVTVDDTSHLESLLVELATLGDVQVERGRASWRWWDRVSPTAGDSWPGP
ncbi:MAG TPA: aspartate kinase [Longimicrobiales bacterium]|nr:aspartate kinase [Longimicrobiales bacterium]